MVSFIKVFSVGEQFDLSEMEAFIPFSDYFLVDTKGPQFGGHGFAFDWGSIQDYKYNVPLLLSGGIDEKLIKAGAYKDLPIQGLDLNSKFETSPGEKNIAMLKSGAFQLIR